jgi:APA family basic amino acid/polyamine antiporter
MTKKRSNLGLTATMAFVISNMVGTGVFTSLGFQLMDIHNIIAVLLVWVAGGIIALCGSLVYSELGAAMPRSGGEYNYLSRIYHPWVGFLSGWVSITVGFAAPAALACMALGKYMMMVLHFASPQSIAIIVLIILTLIHAYDVKAGGRFQTVFTSFNILLILFFIICGLFVTPKLEDFSVPIHQFSWKSVLSPGFAISLFWVSYAYSGWNASAYIAGEIRNPQKMIPKSLFYSTLVVTVLYLLLNFIFLLTSPVSDLKGKVEVGNISAIHIFGQTGGIIMAVFISILLISTVSSYIFVGPRVSQVMGEDIKMLKFLSKKSDRGTPITAIILQTVISICLIITMTFESILLCVSFILTLFTFSTVLGVFVHRIKFKDVDRPYKTWGYPVVPAIFLAANAWALWFLITTRPKESILGFLVLAVGTVFYFVNKILGPGREKTEEKTEEK